MIEIKVLKKVSGSTLAAVNHLMSQMSLGATLARKISPKEFRELLGQKCLSFLTAEASVAGGKSKIIGMLSLYFVSLPSGLIAIVEDLVVDRPYRLFGAAPLLVKKAIEMANRKKARHISLRTNPERAEANKFYLSMGFQKRETNFYRINLFK